MSEREWNRDRVLRLVRRLHRKGVPLNSRYVAETYPRLMGGARRIFTSWKNAIIAAGFDYASVSKRPPMTRWSEELIIERIRSRVRDGLRISMWVVKNDDRALYDAACRYYQSWGSAVEAAGFSHLEVREDKWWTRELVVLAIKRRAHMGESISLLDVKKENPGLYAAAKRYCGSWKAAIEEAGFVYDDVRKIMKWSKEMIIEEIRFRHENRLPINAKAVHRAFQSLINRAIYHFGSWEEAVEAAGFSYDQVVQRWVFGRRKAKLRTYIETSDDTT